MRRREVSSSCAVRAAARIFQQESERSWFVHWCVCDFADRDDKNYRGSTVDAANVAEEIWSLEEGEHSWCYQSLDISYSSFEENALMEGRGAKEKKKTNGGDRRRRCTFLFKALSYLFPKVLRCQAGDAMALAQWRRGHSFLFFSASLPWRLFRRWGGMSRLLCARSCQRLMGGIKPAGHHPRCDLMRAPPRHDARQKDFTRSQMERVRSALMVFLSNEWTDFMLLPKKASKAAAGSIQRRKKHVQLLFRYTATKRKTFYNL